MVPNGRRETGSTGSLIRVGVGPSAMIFLREITQEQLHFAILVLMELTHMSPIAELILPPPIALRKIE